MSGGSGMTEAEAMDSDVASGEAAATDDAPDDASDDASGDALDGKPWQQYDREEQEEDWLALYPTFEAVDLTAKTAW